MAFALLSLKCPILIGKVSLKERLNLSNSHLNVLRKLISKTQTLCFVPQLPLLSPFLVYMQNGLNEKRFIFEVRDLWPELPVAMGVIKNPVIISLLLKFIEVVAYKSAAKVVALSSGMADGVTKYIPQKTELKLLLMAVICIWHLRLVPRLHYLNRFNPMTLLRYIVAHMVWLMVWMQ